jgi:hypothetical protein
MNKYVDRYIYAVTRLLKANQREEVRKELNEHIENSLEKDYSFEKTQQVLKKLGSPKELAYKYRNQGKNLIKQENYEFYKDVVKIGMLVILVFNLAVSAGALLNQIFNQGPAPIGSLIVYFLENFFENVINNLLVGFALITIGFVIWERKGDKLGQTKEWMLKDLPELPRFINKSQKSPNQILLETLAISFLSLFFLTILRFPLLAITLELDTFVLIPASYNRYYIPFVLTVTIYLFNQIWLIIHGGNSVYKVLHSFQSVVLIFFIGMFFLSKPFFVQDDINRLLNNLNISIDEFNLYTNLALVATFIFVLSWELYENYLVWKNYRTKK